MANLDLVNAFNDCIDRIINGQSIEDCLRLYPQYRDVLGPMLEAGRVVQRVRVDAAETAQAQIRVRNRIQQAVMTPPKRVIYPVRRLAMLAASLLFAFVVATGGAAVYAQQSLPGDFLYDLKMLSENIQLSISNNDGVLKQQYATRRITEIQQLFSAGRMEMVTFEGEISAQNDLRWQVASLTVEVPGRISESGAFKVGDRIRVDGVTTTQATVLASQIVLLEPGEEPLVTPLAPTIAPSQTTTLTPTVTQTLSLTPTSTNTPTQQPSATLTLTPTLRPTAMPVSPTRTNIPQSPSATVCVPVQPNGWVVYVVQAGDTLSLIAGSSGISLNELMTANCLTDAGRIVMGQRLYVPRPIIINPTAQPQPQSTAIQPGATDDHGGGSNSGSGGGSDGGDDNGGHGGGSDDGSGHG